MNRSIPLTCLVLLSGCLEATQETSAVRGPEIAKPADMPKPIEVTPDFVTFYSPEEPRMFDDYTHRIAGVAGEHYNIALGIFIGLH